MNNLRKEQKKQQENDDTFTENVMESKGTSASQPDPRDDENDQLTRDRPNTSSNTNVKKSNQAHQEGGNGGNDPIKTTAHRDGQVVSGPNGARQLLGRSNTISEQPGDVVDAEHLTSVTDDLLKIQLTSTIASSDDIQEAVIINYEGPSANISVNKWSPFEISDIVPAMLGLEVSYNTNQQPNVSSLVAGMSSFDSLQQAVDSANLFNKSLMVARIVMKDSLLGMSIENPTIPKKEVTLAIPQVIGSNISVINTANLYANRLLHAAKMVKRMTDILVEMPEKITVQPTPGPGYWNALSQMSFSKGDHPHLYFIRGFNIPPWLAAALDALWAVAPADFNEHGVRTHGGVKYSALRNMAVDQYTSECLLANWTRFCGTQLNVQDFKAMLDTNIFERSFTRVLENVSGKFSMMYSPPQYSRNLAMLLIMASPAIRLDIINTMTKTLLGTGRITKIEARDFISVPNLPSDALGSKMHSALLNVLTVGSSENFVRMIVLETLCSYVDVDIIDFEYPVDAGLLFSLLSLICFMIQFPKLSNNMIYQLGYNITKILENFLPNQMEMIINQYGMFSQYNETTRTWTRLPEKVAMTRSQSQRKRAPSIFIATDRPAGVDGRLWGLIRELAELVTPRIHEVHLGRKQIAHFPFARDDYVGYASWPQTTIDDFANDVDNPMTNRIKTAINLVKNLLDARMIRGFEQSSLPRLSTQYVDSTINALKFAANSIGPLFTYTAASMQRLLMESLGYCYERFDPAQPWFAPLDIGFAPLNGTPNRQGIPFKPIKVAVCPAESLTALTQVEGDFNRNLSSKIRGRASEPINGYRPERIMVDPDAEALYKYWLGIIMRGEEFGRVMQIIGWLTSSFEGANPLSTFVDEMREYFRMSSWVPIVKFLMELYQFDFTEIFTGMYRYQTGIIDGRDISQIVNFYDPVTMVPKTERMRNTIFGRQFQLTDASYARLWTVMSKLVMSPGSPIISTARGVAIGRGAVSELMPYHVNRLREFPTRINVSDIQWRTRQAKGGTELTMEFNGLVITSPYDIELTGTYIITRSFSEIPASHRELVATAIQYGTLAVEATDILVHYTYLDRTDRTVNYTKQMTVDQIKPVLNFAAGQVLTYQFDTTNYATNFSSNSYAIPKYIQWVYVNQNDRKNLFAAVLADSVDRMENTYLPPPQSLGLGMESRGGRMLMTTGEPKIESEYVNWNNPVPTVAKIERADVYNVEIVSGPPTLAPIDSSFGPR